MYVRYSVDYSLFSHPCVSQSLPPFYKFLSCSHFFTAFDNSLYLTKAVCLTMSLELSLEMGGLNRGCTTENTFWPSQESLSSLWFSREEYGSLDACSTHNWLLSVPILCRASTGSHICCVHSFTGCIMARRQHYVALFHTFHLWQPVHSDFCNLSWLL